MDRQEKSKKQDLQISISGTTENLNSNSGKKRPRENSPEFLEVLQEINSFESRSKICSAITTEILKNLNLDEPDTKLQLLKGKSAQDFMVTIRERKKVEILARTEREKRRRRILIEQQDAQVITPQIELIHAQKELENKKREELMLQRLSKQSREEREITAKLLEVRKQKEIIRKNRIT